MPLEEGFFQNKTGNNLTKTHKETMTEKVLLAYLPGLCSKMLMLYCSMLAEWEEQEML